MNLTQNNYTCYNVHRQTASQVNSTFTNNNTSIHYILKHEGTFNLGFKETVIGNEEVYNNAKVN